MDSIHKLNKFFTNLSNISGEHSLVEAIKQGFEACFEGVMYGFKTSITEPGKEPTVSYSPSYSSDDRAEFAKSLANKASRLGETNPHFGKPMTVSGRDGVSVSVTPLRDEWDDAYVRHAIPKGIQERVSQLISEHGWDIYLSKSGIQYDKNHVAHGGLPTEYRGEIGDPGVVEEISRALGPFGFKHEIDHVEAHYGSTGHGPIDTETFPVDVWKYTGKPVQ